jgi:hypothetical protein
MRNACAVLNEMVINGGCSLSLSFALRFGSWLHSLFAWGRLMMEINGCESGGHD